MPFMTSPFDLAAELGVVPVIAIDNAAHAIPLADALLEGGLPIAEITFRTSAAAEVIARIARDRPRMLVGAGTILDRASLDAARESGARFGLAPGFDSEIVSTAAARAFPFAPGVMTPTDLTAATRHGARMLKFFPAGSAGGPSALTAIAAPFAHLDAKFIPTGGITEQTIGDWLKLPSVAAVGGTWIACQEDIRAERWDHIAALARRAVEAARAARGASR